MYNSSEGQAGRTGPVNQQVSTNVQARRAELGMTKAELSRRCISRGRNLTYKLIDRIEAGTRSIDVDDLVVLAKVLRTDPMTLMSTNPTKGIK